MGHSEGRSEILIVGRRAVPTIALAWGEEPDLGPLGRVVNGSGTTRAGNPWLRRALCEGAWAASKSKGTYLQAQFRRLAALRGPQRALIVVANSILTAGYYMLHRATNYQLLGPDHFDKPNTVRATHRLVKRLEALGHRVILEPRIIAEPSS